jgi:hypothetical protein
MNSGFYLTLMIGPVVPVPVPQEVLDALTSLSVTTNSDSGSGFQLEFTLSNRSPLQTNFLLAGGASIPLVRVLIIITSMAKRMCCGWRDGQSRDPSGADASHSVTHVTGEDLSRVMDYSTSAVFHFLPCRGSGGRILLAIFLGILTSASQRLIDIQSRRIAFSAGGSRALSVKTADEVGVFLRRTWRSQEESVGYWGPEIEWGDHQKRSA